MPPTSPNIPGTPDLSGVSHTLGNPPARLVDRLSRRAARRKSSASSRRSSLSSGTRKPSHHVAQHLRRASFLDTRKARLADRAAHVEAVRMRAALIQAVPRATITSSEERAMAAATAREKKLAQVAAACAEEVLKAKRRAIETKARKLQHEIKTRQDMEERWAEADRRRAEYQRSLHARRIRRASSPVRKLPMVSEDDEAVLRIQRIWRLTRRRGIINAWLALDFDLHSVKDMSFEDLGVLLSSTKLLNATSGLLGILGIDGSSRTFLTAYLVLTHPETVFSTRGELEADLTTKARELTTIFEDAVGRLASWNGYTTRLDVAAAIMTYSTAFEAWKANDASALLDVMVATFVEFDAIWTSVKDDNRGRVADDYKMAIRDNQAMLLSKIRKLSPQADKLLKQAVMSARRGRAKALTVDEEPRARPVDFSPPEQSKFFSFALPSNRQMTHELAINKDFRLSTLGDNRAEIIALLCASMQEGLARGDQALWTVSMAECIRGKLLGLASGSVLEQIQTVLDPAHVQAQAAAGVFSYDTFFEFMASVLPKICAPVRDAEIKALVELLTDSQTAAIDKLQKLLHGIDLLALDHTNYMLVRAGHILLAEAPGYERRMFARDVSESGLGILTSWWAHAKAELSQQAVARDPENLGLGYDNPTRQAIYNKALVDLVVNPLDTPCPETLALDREKLRDMRRAMMDMVCVGATLLTAKNLLKRDVRSAWKTEATRMLGVDADRAYAVLESAHNLPVATQSALQAACKRFYGPNGMRDPVMRLIFQRLKTHVLARLNASSSEERVRAISTAGESLARAGLPEFVVTIGEFVGLLSRIKQVDWEAHGEWYLGLEI